VYNVALVDESKCIAEKGCRLCIMYCPEADCIMMNDNKKAYVFVDRCKGCDLCKVVCSTHNAISMHPVDPTNGQIVLEAEAGETAGLGQAYSG
jgi:pyruvate ferredoxin oxidoreductase delta subunit